MFIACNRDSFSRALFFFLDFIVDEICDTVISFFGIVISALSKAGLNRLHYQGSSGNMNNIVRKEGIENDLDLSVIHQNCATVPR